MIKIVTVVKDDLEGLKRTAKSIEGQTLQVSWIIVTPPIDSEMFEYISMLVMKGTVSRVISDKGIGVYPAMNDTINNLSQSDWVWFLNAGDEFGSKESYEKMMLVVRSSSHQWIYGGHYLISAEGKLLGQVKSPSSFKAEQQLFARRYVSHQSTIFAVKILLHLKGFDTRYKIASDWDLLVRASRVDPGERTEELISRFHMGGLSTLNRQLGNKELFRIRQINLQKKYCLKNYYWFYYRAFRNYFVLLLESRYPKEVNIIRKFRLSIKTLSRQVTSKFNGSL